MAFYQIKNYIFIIFSTFLILLHGILIYIPLILFFPDYRMLLYTTKVSAKILMFLMNKILGIKYKILGEQFIPKNGELIIASKHQTFLECIILFMIIPNPFIVLKKELFRMPIIGWLLKALGMIGINRKQPINALKHILKQSNNPKNSYKNLIIFPEGSRNNITEKYNPGIFLIAQSLKKGVVPVALNCKRYWSGLFQKNTNGTIIIEFLQPIQHSEIKNKEKFMDTLQKTIDERSSELMHNGNNK